MRSSLVALCLLAASPAAAWDTLVLPYRDIRSATLSHVEGALHIVIVCTVHADFPDMRRDGLGVSIHTEPSRQFAVMPGDPALFTLFVGEEVHEQPAQVDLNDSHDTSFTTVWPNMDRIIRDMIEQDSIRIEASTDDGLIEISADMTTEGLGVAGRELLEACRM